VLPTLQLLEHTDFPPLTRGRLQTLQVNLGYRCNQQCVHCHVNAGPRRKEMMDANTVAAVLRFLAGSGAHTLDLTGGAPELHPQFRDIVGEARALGKHVIDRCNLTILEEPGQEHLAGFLAAHGVEVIASLPCYLEENVDAQRGKGVFAASIRGLQRLNALGYGREPDKSLHLVFNPQGASLPPSQSELEAEYKRQLDERFGVVFNRLFTLANMPIQRFGSTLLSKGNFQDYLRLLHEAFEPSNLASVMCRSLVSIDWRGHVYDCDFNQMLDLPTPGADASGKPLHVSQLVDVALEGRPIVVREHCYGCTAGQGSSCGGALS
jgi:radical SAM/Cys-rich protein